MKEYSNDNEPLQIHGSYCTIYEYLPDNTKCTMYGSSIIYKERKIAIFKWDFNKNKTVFRSDRNRIIYSLF